MRSERTYSLARPRHPQTQVKIKRRHQVFKNRILLGDIARLACKS
jgi:hypothetical protein